MMSALSPTCALKQNKHNNVGRRVHFIMVQTNEDYNRKFIKSARAYGLNFTTNVDLREWFVMKITF